MFKTSKFLKIFDISGELKTQISVPNFQNVFPGEDPLNPPLTFFPSHVRAIRGF